MNIIKKRNLLFVLLLSILTFGIYSVYWIVRTTMELRKLNVKAPHPLLLLVISLPIAIPLAVSLLGIMLVLSPLL